jgi:hypothetical protein
MGVKKGVKVKVEMVGTISNAFIFYATKMNQPSNQRSQMFCCFSQIKDTKKEMNSSLSTTALVN